MFVSIVSSVAKLLERRNLCENVSDENLHEKMYMASLMLGIEGFRNYTQAAEILGIKKEYLYYLISTHREEIGEPLHHPIFGKENILSVYQIQRLKKILAKEKYLN